MDVGCGGAGLGYSGSAEFLPRVSLRNRLGAMFLRNLRFQDSGPLLPCRAFSRHHFQRPVMLISMLCFALAFITAGPDGCAWTAALHLQKGQLT